MVLKKLHNDGAKKFHNDCTKKVTQIMVSKQLKNLYAFYLSIFKVFKKS